MEVVTSILASVGQIIGGIAPYVNVDKRTQSELRKQEGAPLKKDWFSQYSTNNTKQYYIIILVVIMAIVLAIMAMAFSKSKD